MKTEKENIQEIIKEYSLDYCHSLEMVYGDGMMSEGGIAEIESFLSPLNLAGKRVLDFGCGLGGLSLYLAENIDCHIVALDINPEMIEQVSSSNRAKSMKDNLEFKLYSDIENLPFIENFFDCIISKGVLTHVMDKAPLFSEFSRILNSQGQLLINDWLSHTSGLWGPNVQKMVEIEGLSIYALSLADYQRQLFEGGFSLLQHQEQSRMYALYNRQIAENLSEALGDVFAQKFSQQLRQEYVKSYNAIADAMESRELQVHTFLCSVYN